MLTSLANSLRGIFSLTVVALNTFFWCVPLFAVALFKLLVPIPAWRTLCGRLLNEIALRWAGVNSRGLELTKSIHWDIEGADGLSPDRWYLLVANHQTMVDIVVLQKTFFRKVPMLKFFIKKELMWVPFLGLAWWALDFPFMKRTSSSDRDLKTARKACEKFSGLPVTIMNFVEGTRFTPAKREQRGSPYRNLLRPKAGGIAVVLGCMGRRLHSVLDTTIVYPQGPPGLWQFLCSRAMTVKVRVRQLAVTEELLGDYPSDEDFREQVNAWLNELWFRKDNEIERLRR